MTKPSHHIATLALPDGREVRVSLQEGKDGLAVDLRTYAAFSAAKVRMPTQSALTVPLSTVPDLLLALEQAPGLAAEFEGGRA